MERDDRVMVLGEDVGKKGGVFGATEGLWAKYGDKRVLDTPLTEGMIAGAAMGAAVYGLRPIAEMQFADFVYPAFNQIVSEISRIHYRSNGTFSAPMVIRMPYGGGVHGALYHSQSNEALLHRPPSASRSWRPARRPTRRACSRPSIRDPGPGDVLRAQEDLPPLQGRGARWRHRRPDRQGRRSRAPGKHLSIFCYGFMRICALEAAETLAREDGVEAEVVDLRTLRPLDTETILASVGRTGKALVVHEANRFGGFGAEIAAEIGERAFEQLDGPVTRLAGPDVPAVPYHHTLEDWFMINPARIVEAARRLAAY